MLCGKKIIVTGSSGFVGSHLVNQLTALNATVRELDLAKGIDLTDWSQVKDVGAFDVLIHLAAKIYVPDSFDYPRNFFHTNISGLINALELCRIHRGKMVFASSYVYGQPKYLPIDEKHPLDGVNPYADGKIICERLCESYHRHFDLRVVILRPFNIYGPMQDKRFLIPSIIGQLKSGHVRLEDPSPKRDLIFVDDVVQAYIRAIQYEKTTFEIFNIGQGRSYSVRQVVQAIVKNASGNIKIEFAEKNRKGGVSNTVADISKAKDLLGWAPKVSLEDGLRACLKGASGAGKGMEGGRENLPKNT